MSLDNKSSRIIPILSFIANTEDIIKPSFKNSEVFNESEIIIDREFDFRGVKISSNIFSNNSQNINNIKKQYPYFDDYYSNNKTFEPDLLWVKKKNNKPIKLLFGYDSRLCDLSQERNSC